MPPSEIIAGDSEAELAAICQMYLAHRPLADTEMSGDDPSFWGDLSGDSPLSHHPVPMSGIAKGFSDDMFGESHSISDTYDLSGAKAESMHRADDTTPKRTVCIDELMPLSEILAGCPEAEFAIIQQMYFASASEQPCV